jgi:hypothetical protein
MPLTWSALCLPGVILSLVALSPVALSLIPRISRIPGPRIPGPRGLGGASGGTLAWCVWWRLWSPRVVEPRGARGTRRSRALLARGSGARSRARLARPGTANARHRVVGTLPGPVVLWCLPAGTRRVSGPGRHAAVGTGSLRPWRQVSGTRAIAVSAARVALVAGINGVSVGFQVRVAQVSVAVGVGGVTGMAVRASAGPAALTIHPVPPGHGVRCSPPTR